MDTLLNLWRAHSTAIVLCAAWSYSAAMSTMPPLNAKAGFWSTWLYKFAQAVAANFQKHDDPTGIGGKDTQPSGVVIPLGKV